MNGWQQYSHKKIFPPEAIEEKVLLLRREKKSIATLNGAFDLLHAGHMYMLYEASQKADVLIVAVNSDASVKAYKDPKRPIIPLKYRLEMLAAIEFVDFLTWFDDLNPCSILEKLRPDVHVNGSEYGQECLEADVVKKYGGRLHLVDRIPHFSTSEIVESIKKALCD